MIDTIINAYRFNLKYAHELVLDVDENLMTKPGGPGLENHPAFTLGHLVTAAALTSKYIGGGPSNYQMAGRDYSEGMVPETLKSQ